MNFYVRFQANLAHHMAPLYALMKKGVEWHWDSSHQRAFNKIKDLISEDIVLAHYSTDGDIVLTCDASDQEAPEIYG